MSASTVTDSWLQDLQGRMKTQKYQPVKTRQGSATLQATVVTATTNEGGSLCNFLVRVDSVADAHKALESATASEPAPADATLSEEDRALRLQPLDFVPAVLDNGKNAIRFNRVMAQPKSGPAVLIALPEAPDFVVEEGQHYEMSSFPKSGGSYNGAPVTRAALHGVYVSHWDIKTRPDPMDAVKRITKEKRREKKLDEIVNTRSARDTAFLMVQSGPGAAWREAPKTDGEYAAEDEARGTWMKFSFKINSPTRARDPLNDEPMAVRLRTLYDCKLHWQLPAQLWDGRWDDLRPQVRLMHVTKHPQTPKPEEGFVSFSTYEGYDATSQTRVTTGDTPFVYSRKTGEGNGENSDVEDVPARLPRLGIHQEWLQWNPETPDDQKLGRADVDLYSEHCFESGITAVDTWARHMMTDPVDFYVLVRVEPQPTMCLQENCDLESSPYPAGYFRVKALAAAPDLDKMLVGPERRVLSVTPEWVKQHLGERKEWYKPYSILQYGKRKIPATNPLNKLPPAQARYRNLTELESGAKYDYLLAPGSPWRFAVKCASDHCWKGDVHDRVGQMTPEQGTLAMSMSSADMQDFWPMGDSHMVVWAYKEPQTDRMDEAPATETGTKRARDTDKQSAPKRRRTAKSS